MAGSLRSVTLAMCAVGFVTSNGTAFWGRSGWRPSGTTAGAPAPTWYYVPVATPCWGAPAAPPPLLPAPATLPKPRALIKPLPAPTSKEPPLRAPSVTESRSYGGVMPTQATEVTPGRCKVGFWNITGADVTLTIDSQQRRLAKDRAVTLELGRSFVWQLSGRGPQTERVPDGQYLFEVILRPQSEPEATK